jgi:hypothetical protein
VTALGCSEVEELAPELALGTLPGDQRSAVLSHLDGCSPCRLVVKELSDVADALLMAAPEVQPPEGFARRVTAGMRPPRRVPWRPVAAAAAVALVAGILVGFLPGRLSSGTVRVRSARFAAVSEPVTGEVYMRAGDPSWVFMTVKTGGPAVAGDRYTCELVMLDGEQVALGSFPMADGQGSWGRAVGVPVADIRSVILIEADGATAASARLTSG